MILSALPTPRMKFVPATLPPNVGVGSMWSALASERRWNREIRPRTGRCLSLVGHGASPFGWVHVRAHAEARAEASGTEPRRSEDDLPTRLAGYARS